MQQELEKLKQEVESMKKELQIVTDFIKQLKGTTYKTSNTEIINREVKYLQKVYDKDGVVVIN